MATSGGFVASTPLPCPGNGHGVGMIPINSEVLGGTSPAPCGCTEPWQGTAPSCHRVTVSPAPSQLEQRQLPGTLSSWLWGSSGTGGDTHRVTVALGVLGTSPSHGLWPEELKNRDSDGLREGTWGQGLSLSSQQCPVLGKNSNAAILSFNYRIYSLLWLRVRTKKRKEALRGSFDV